MSEYFPGAQSAQVPAASLNLPLEEKRGGVGGGNTEKNWCQSSGV